MTHKTVRTIQPARWLKTAAIKCIVPLSVGGFLGGCDRQAAPKPAPAPPIEVTVSQPVQKEVAEAIEYTGTTSATESVEVRPRVGGFLEQIHFKAPAKVKQGDLLFTIDVRPFKNRLDAKLALLQAKQAQLEKAEFEVERVNRLIGTDAAARDEQVTAVSTRDALKADIAGVKAEIDQATLELDWCRVTAPIYGRISRHLADAGNVIQADSTVLAEIVSDDTLYAYFNVSERDMLRLRERVRQRLAEQGIAAASQPSLHEVHWPVFAGLMTETGYPHQGVLDYAAPAVDSSTGTVQVRGRFDNRNGIMTAGLFVRVSIPISLPKPALMVTELAIGLDQGQRYLLVVDDQNVVRYRRVKSGILSGGYRVIQEGLAPNEWVIVNGLQRVRPGVTVVPQRVDMTEIEKPSGQPTSAPSRVKAGTPTTEAKP